MILVECILDSVVECLAVILGVSHLLWLPVAEKPPGIANAKVWKETSGTPHSMDSELDLRSCERDDYDRTIIETKWQWKSNMWSALQWWMYVWFEKKQKKKQQVKRQTSIGFKVNLLSFDIFSGGHIYNYLKAWKRFCFIQLFVFTRYRCGSQVLLAYKRLKWRQKREM